MSDENRGKGEDGKLLYCSFCGKSQHEVRKLIAGPSVFICDECDLASCVGPDQKLMVACKAAARAAGLVFSEPKGFGFRIEKPATTLPAPSAATDFVQWGTEVKGKLGRTATEEWKRVGLMYVTALSLKLKYVTKNFLRRWQALFINHFLHRRELMCYKFFVTE